MLQDDMRTALRALDQEHDTSIYSFFEALIQSNPILIVFISFFPQIYMLVTCMTRMERRSTPVQHSLVRNIIGTVIFITRPKTKTGLRLERPMMGSLGQDIVRTGTFRGVLNITLCVPGAQLGWGGNPLRGKKVVFDGKLK